MLMGHGFASDPGTLRWYSEDGRIDLCDLSFGRLTRMALRKAAESFSDMTSLVRPLRRLEGFDQ